MKYPKVRKAHIVPRVHLRNFADRSQLAIHVLPDGKERTVSINDAAVKRDFYRRMRPRDGSEIYDIEWALSHIEGVVGPLLSNLEAAWPLSREDKTTLAELFAYQAVRGPSWKAWYQGFAQATIAKKRRDPVHELQSGILVPLTERHIQDLEAHLLSDTQRLIRMMMSGQKRISIFGSMTWDLIKFDEPLLVISDHPIVEVPLKAGSRMPEVSHGHGALNVLEVRVPIAPDLALLMTWKDPPDSRQVLPGNRQHADNINAFTVAQAERQWLWRPGTTPARGHGPFAPLSAELCPGYTALRGEASVVRKKVAELMNARLGEQPTAGPQDVEIVTVS